MRRLETSIHGISGIVLAMVLSLSTPGCSGMFGGSRMIEAFKIGGGAPSGQTEPEIVVEDSVPTSDSMESNVQKNSNSIDPFNEP